MYGWIWGHLPGPMPIRILVTLLFVFLLIAVLFLWVFPAINAALLIDDPEISSSGGVVRQLRSIDLR